MNTSHDVLWETDIHQLELVGRGKVRDSYAVGTKDLLLVTCDRLSAFDVVLPTPIPGKGAILNQLSHFWFEKTASIVPNHLTGLTVDDVLGDHPLLPQLRSRSMVVKRLRPLPFEAIVRGYLAGSGWKEYRRTGDICGISLPHGLEQAARLPHPLFTPSSKAEAGHDENITRSHLEQLIGPDITTRVEEISLALYEFAAAHAAERGIIIADTKFEFGLDETGQIVLMDEVLTPDSSRFWPADDYRVGMSPPSYDKQFVRDWLERLDWDKVPPGPALPDDIVTSTRDRYLEALDVLTDGAVRI